MQWLFSFVFVFLVVSAPVALANFQTFQVEGGQVQMDIPEGWQTSRDLFGVPLMILGPQTNGRRPVITVTPSGLTGFHLDPKKIGKDQAGYRTWREAWLKEVGGKSIRYYPYKTEKWPSVSEVHSIGYRYSVEDMTFDERSHYVICNGQLFHLKSLVYEKNEQKYADTLAKSMRSFKCE